LNTLLLVGIALSLGSVGQVSMKWGMNHAQGLGLARAIFTPYVFLGFVLYGISSLFWLMAIRKAQLSYVYPLIAVSYIVVAVLSYFIFHDKIGWQRSLGIALICVGVVFVARS